MRLLLFLRAALLSSRGSKFLGVGQLEDEFILVRWSDVVRLLEEVRMVRLEVYELIRLLRLRGSGNFPLGSRGVLRGSQASE